MKQRTDLLASYVTFKQLYRGGNYRSQYQVLSEFIKYVIVEENKYIFSLEELRNLVYKHFEFNIPIAVLRTAVTKMKAVRSNDGINYSVDYKMLQTDKDLSSIHENARKDNEAIVQKLIAFAKTKQLNPPLNEAELIKCFVSFMLDKQKENRYQPLISEFIIFNSDDAKMVEQLKSIREGVILYTGINYGINEIGSIKKELTLYLHTEIILDIMGYNGEIYKQFAQDFIEIIDKANRPKRMIQLRYFEDVENEIKDLFFVARDVVNKKKMPKPTSAMNTILDGCSDITDLDDKEADFFQVLHSKYHIYKDEKNDYYATEEYYANQEDIKFNGAIADEDTLKGLKIVSHINKLRKNQKFSNYLDSSVIYVTDTKRILEVSNSKANELKNGDERICDFAVSLSNITNILWYKTNSGFGNNTFPKNLDSVLKAKVILSKWIAANVTLSFEKLNSDIDQGLVNEELVVARLLGLREKAVKPEEIHASSLDSVLDFSPEALQKYEDAMKTNRIKLQEKDKELEQVRKDQETKDKQNEQKISDLQEKLNEKEEREAVRELKLKEYEEKEASQIKRKKKTCNILKFIGFIVATIVVLGLLSWGIFALLSKINPLLAQVVLAVFDSVATVVSIIVFIKKVYVEIFNKNKQE